MWSSGHGPWLQTQRSRFDSLRYQIFWELLGLERGPLSLVMIIEELFQGNSGFGLENRNSRLWGFVAVTTLKWALTSPISGGRSDGIICLRTETTEFFVVVNAPRSLLLALVIINMMTSDCFLSTFQSRWLLLDASFLTSLLKGKLSCSSISDTVSLRVPNGVSRGLFNFWYSLQQKD
jgi:hypothetical protein